MTNMAWVAGLAFWEAIVLVLFAIWILKVSSDATRRERQFEERIRRLEDTLAARGLHTGPAPAPQPVSAPVPVLVAPALPPPLAAPAPTPKPRSAMSVSQMEEWVGSVWLQNAGSVLVLVGVFFLILWGYSTGRLGPEVLVAAGVAMGLGFLWRGDRVTRTTPAFGHALLGIGVGIVYLSLYVGHVQLGVLPRAVALTLLVLVSVGSIPLGLRYRVQTIAMLGVIGAFVPPLLGAWLPLAGFALGPATLLAYLAGVGLSVYALSARAGWSRLDLTALVLATITWGASVTGSWTWPIEIGLAAMFVLYGLAPLPAMARRPGKPRVSDMAVIAMAPFLFTLVSVSFIASADRHAVAVLSLVLTVIYAAAAAWTDSVRRERDLWKALTAASVLFLTLGLQRAVGDQSTTMAWALEGLFLVTFGLRAESGWLRGCGTVVTAMSVLALVFRLGEGWSAAGAFPFLNAHAVRDLAAIASLLVGSHVLGRERSRLSSDERFLAEGWTLLGNATLAAWLARECSILALRVSSSDHLLWATASTGLAWTAQTAVLFARGLQGRAVLRWAAYTLAMLTIVLGVDVLIVYGFNITPGEQAVVFVWLVVLAAAMTLCDRLASVRADLAKTEWKMPEAWTLGIVVLWMAWTACEAQFVAAWIGADSRREAVLTAAFTSAAWLAEATVLTILGWIRKAAFLRWVGLGLFGWTVLKILLIDLQRVDVFWRFLSAVLAGVALLAVSYAYQRKRRLEAATETASPVVSPVEN